MKLSIITPVFGHADMTANFISAVANHADENVELIIVDNNSPDATLSVLSTAKRSFPHLNLKIISQNKNLGFGGGNNLGSAIATSDNLLFLSNDVLVLGNFVTPVIEIFEKESNVVFGPHLIAFDSGWNTYKDGHNQPVTIPYVEGFCLAITKTTFNMVQGFDEEFFLDLEDLDLSYRLRMAGVDLAQVNLPLMHQLGGSFDNLSENRMDITRRSQQYFLRKWGLHQ